MMLTFETQCNFCFCSDLSVIEFTDPQELYSVKKVINIDHIVTAAFIILPEIREYSHYHCYFAHNHTRVHDTSDNSVTCLKYSKNTKRVKKREEKLYLYYGAKFAIQKLVTQTPSSSQRDDKMT